MNFYVLSRHKIQALENRLASNFIVEDLIEILRDSETSVVEKSNIADMLQQNNSRLKYRYVMSITRK